MYPFDQTDGKHACAEINKESLKWAMAQTPSETLQRYLNKGKKLVIGDDIGPLNAGPLWIWTPLVRLFKFLRK